MSVEISLLDSDLSVGIRCLTDGTWIDFEGMSFCFFYFSAV